MRSVLRILTIPTLLWPAAACHVSPPGSDKPSTADAGPPIAAPTVNAPSETPLQTVAIQGTAPGASKVVVKVKDGNQAAVSSLLPDGNFCSDVNLITAMTSTFEVYAVSDTGNISMPTEVTVTQNNDAPTPDPRMCNPDNQCQPEETCGNGEDDDCNGFKDECDGACNGCTDDDLEPNDSPFEVPMLTAGTYNALQICPCRPDWYAFEIFAGDRIHATATFNSGDVDIDLKLFEASSAEMGGAPCSDDTGPCVSSGTTGTEEIDYTSTGGGTYYLKVFTYPEDGLTAGAYDLTID